MASAHRFVDQYCSILVCTYERWIRLRSAIAAKYADKVLRNITNLRVALGDRVRDKIAGFLPASVIPPGFDRPSSVDLKEVGVYTVAFRSDTSDEKVIAESFDNESFFSAVPEYVAKPGDTIIDVGAHIGTFSVLASSKVEAGRVYAIEASHDSFIMLRINLALNRCENVVAHHGALSNVEGPIQLFHDSGNWGHSIVGKKRQRYETVQALTLEAFLTMYAISHCNFMKLNCEGAEFPILLGASTAVLRQFDVMLVLYHTDLWTANSVDDLEAHFKRSGFRTRVNKTSQHRGWVVATKLS